MPAILGHVRADRRDLVDLVDERVWVRPYQAVPAVATPRRLQVMRDVRREGRAECPRVAGLAALPLAAGSPWRGRFGVRWIGRGWDRRVGRVAVQAIPEIGQFRPEVID